MSLDSAPAVDVDRTPVLNLDSSVELLRAISEVLDIRGVFPRVSEIVTKVLPHDHLQLIFRDQTGGVVLEARSNEDFPDYGRVTSPELPEMAVTASVPGGLLLGFGVQKFAVPTV